MVRELKLYWKLRPDIQKLKELSTMKLSYNVAGQAVLTTLHMANMFTAMVPHKYQFILFAVLGFGNIVLSVLAHLANPDGTPAAMPYALTDEQMAEYQRIFSAGAKIILLCALLFGLTPMQAQTPPAPVWQPQYFVGTGVTYDYYGPTGFAANTEFAALLKGNTYSYSTLELTRTQATVRTGAAYMFYNANHWSLFGLVDGGIATGTGPTLGSFSGGGFGGYDLGGKLTKDASHLFIGAGVRLINTSGQTTQPIFGFIIGKAF